MLKIKFYHEKQKQGFGLLGSESRCSITRWKVVLLNNGKKRGRKRLVAIFKSICNVCKFVVKIFVALDALAKLVLFILNKFYS